MSFKKVCKVCGREFHSVKYSSRYCSENCYVKARNWARQTRHALDIQGDRQTQNDMRTSIIVNKNQYAVVREIALRECMTIKEIIYSMFELGINRYELKHGKVHVRKPKGEKDLF